MRFLPSYILIPLLLANSSTGYVQTPYKQSVVTAPYQVSLYLTDNYNPSNAIHNYPICSATIIQPFHCITSAACVHSHILAYNITRRLSPNSLYIIGGNFSEVRSNIGYIQDIHVHPGYNAATNENDIAILTMETPFDLGGSRDYQWVQLADKTTQHQRCYQSLYSANATKAGQSYPFAEQRQVSVVNSSFCNPNASHEYAQLDRIDLCSYYQFEHPMLCQYSRKALTFSYDRGAALICDNKLAGILSVVLPANQSNATTEYCHATSQTNAYFTNPALYLDWIRSIIVANASAEAIEGVSSSISPSVPAYQSVATATNPKKPLPSAASTTMKSHLTALLTLTTCLFAYGFSR